MDDTKATETIVPAIAPEEKVIASTDDAETRFAVLETEKAKILQERDNYKEAYLKEARKTKTEDLDETDDERIERIARKAMADSDLARIAREQDVLIQRALKENKELKLAQLNKTTSPATIGTHSESTPVTDTLITPDQMAYFKSKKYTDKDIERYKKNLLKNTR